MASLLSTERIDEGMFHTVTLIYVSLHRFLAWPHPNASPSSVGNPHRHIVMHGVKPRILQPLEDFLFVFVHGV